MLHMNPRGAPKERRRREMFLCCRHTACGVALSFMYLDLGKTRSLGLTSKKKKILGLASMQQELGLIKDIFRTIKWLSG